MQEQVSNFTKFKRFLNTVRAENLILGVYTAISFLLVFLHEPWRDEAQFWLLARDASLPEILGNISKEGIPPLWQLLLKPFTLLGLPYDPTMSIFSSLLVAVAAWIFVKKAPFTRYAKYILLMSPVFIYCYATISRSYSLMPIIFMLLAIVYPKRLQKPILYGLLIALLFEVHVILWGMVAALAIEFLIATIQAYKKDKSIKRAATSLTAAIPLLIAGLHYVLWFSAGARASVAVSGFTIQTNPLRFVLQLVEGIESVFGNTLQAGGNIGILLALFLLTISVISIARNKCWWKYVLIAGAAILFEAAISGFVYADGNFRSISVFLILMFVLWLAKSDHLSMEIRFLNTRTSWIAVVCIYTFFGMLTIAPRVLEDIRYPYSDSKYAAAYIEQNIPSDALILTSSNAEISAISAYLKDYTFYDSEKEKAFSYFTWDRTPSWSGLYGEEINGERRLSLVNRLCRVAKEAIERSNGTEDGFYYVSVLEPSTSESDAVYWEHLIYQSPEDCVSKENYQILYLSFEDANQLIQSCQEAK